MEQHDNLTNNNDNDNTGRRLRGRTSNSNSSSNNGTATAATAGVASFVTVSRKALETLMQDHGFSRQRAVATLLQELSVSTSSSASSTPSSSAAVGPSDEELFKFMRLYSLGMEQAASAWTVAQAVLQRCEGSSMEAALGDLTERLANINPTQLKQSNAIVATTTNGDTATLPTSPSLAVRIVPVQQQTLTTPSTSMIKQLSVDSSSLTTRTKATNKKSKITSSSIPTKTTTKGNKQASAADVVPRARADSVTEAVTVKLAADSSSKQAPTGRAKRSRSADEAAELQHNNNASPATAATGNSKRPRRCTSTTISSSSKVE